MKDGMAGPGVNVELGGENANKTTSTLGGVGGESRGNGTPWEKSGIPRRVQGKKKPLKSGEKLGKGPSFCGWE